MEIVEDQSFHLPAINDDNILDQKIDTASKILRAIKANRSNDKLNEILDEGILQNIFNCLQEAIANSIDANSTMLRVRIKFDKRISSLVITIGDNGDGKNSSHTQEKCSGYLGGKGIGLDTINIICNGKVRLIRGEEGALITMKINMRYFDEFFIKNGIYQMLKDGDMTQEEFNAHLQIGFQKVITKIQYDLSSGILTEEEANKLKKDYEIEI